MFPEILCRTYTRQCIVRLHTQNTGEGGVVRRFPELLIKLAKLQLLESREVSGVFISRTLECNPWFRNTAARFQLYNQSNYFKVLLIPFNPPGCLHV